jgi:hypothetical protein
MLGMLDNKSTTCGISDSGHRTRQLRARLIRIENCCHITRDLAKELPPEQINAFVQGAVKSARQGDKAGLLKIVNESHAASNSVRLSQSGTRV